MRLPKPLAGNSGLFAATSPPTGAIPRSRYRFYRLNGFSNEGYALIVDFSRFFDNIRHDTLFTLLERRITDSRVQDLVRRFVPVFGPGMSLGLGSQVSQICAIFYPDKLDRIIKEKLRIKYYGRYMDDLYLIHADKDSAKRMRRKLKKFKPLIASGKMSFADLRTAYQSWRGSYMRRFNAHYRIRYMDRLYNELFVGR